MPGAERHTRQRAAIRRALEREARPLSPADRHHHHFRCRRCERVYEVPGCARGITALAPAGFEVDGHELVLYGRCGPCARAA